MKCDVPDAEYFHPLDGSEVARSGKDVTLVRFFFCVHLWMLAAE